LTGRSSGASWPGRTRSESVSRLRRRWLPSMRYQGRGQRARKCRLLL
jgi:hypothetical protein